MIYTQKEIREAHERITTDIENAEKTIKGITLALECQQMVLDHLTSIMEPEEETPEEEEEEEESEENLAQE